MPPLTVVCPSTQTCLKTILLRSDMQMGIHAFYAKLENEFSESECE